MNFDRRKVERVKERYPVGTRIELKGLCNDEPGMPPRPVRDGHRSGRSTRPAHEVG